uniref:C3H1-type domain-containing protein n=1 Tax=Alexandrium monilatum TaxID=311494 RepID=A0A7S4W4R2_9DINO|mmetsp:Transcript_87422/g.270662  ORF Transcript_87422/g.270662 Transcript_87422/m.270662 type:complete len:193 (-) Transcript_87422:105-683(-)
MSLGLPHHNVEGMGYQSEAIVQHAQQQQQQPATEAGAARAQEINEAERQALLSQGFNTRRLPLRPGVPPCGYYMRKGVCKSGKSCLWDHPEMDLNSAGYPLRPGLPPCAPYQRTQTCKFGTLCSMDHPEFPGQEVREQPGALPLALAKAAAQQHQMHLMLQLQLVQEMPSLQEADAMMDAWVRFRIAFSKNA